ncbi:MAG: DUF4867 family protein [Prolixibacteraceae bacterium]|jgi:hypothetical protein|nr:DUF4867 family protein [Prolixibacteraceae bacterium]
MNFSEFAKINDHLLIRDVHDRSFIPYGKIITGYNFSGLMDFMEKETGVPDQGNIYKASVPELEQFPVKERLENKFYGEMPIEIGYCNGKNTTLNGLEYHIGSEINIAVTDMVLMLGKLQNVINNKYKSEEVEVFFVPKATAIQLYETTLHFSPCKTDPEGFKCIVILPRGTNEPLVNDNAKHGERLLFARNKWLLAHPERKPLIEKGAWPGITGENLELKIS